jgi:type I restriction-modification system DNA methylase subunit
LHTTGRRSLFWGDGLERHAELPSLTWATADLLRHNCRQHAHGQAILPLTVLRHLDCVPDSTPEKVREHPRYEEFRAGDYPARVGQ